MDANNKSGRIITFYSFKGGTGRSMAVANVGYLLARTSQKPVLLIDWDVEAPGLHRYFRRDFSTALNSSPGTRQYDQALERAPGLIDLLIYYRTVLLQAFDLDPAAGTQAQDQVVKLMRQTLFAQFEDYVLKTNYRNLWMMKAGDFGPDYASNVQDFDWKDFIKRDPFFFQEFRFFLAEKFETVLIDSRTGLTDSSGICTQGMPDNLVLVFAPNRQNVEGLIEVLRRINLYRSADPNSIALSVYPLASRIDATVSSLRRLWRYGGRADDDEVEGYQRAFERMLRETYKLEECSLENYFDLTQVPHDVSYAYGENIAAKAGTTEKLSMGAAYANLTRWLVSDSAAWEPIDEKLPEARALGSAWRELVASRVRRLLKPAAILILFLLLSYLPWQNGPLAIRLVQFIPTEPPSPQIAMVTIKPGTEPPEIFSNDCTKRIFFADLIRKLQSSNAALLVMDASFSPSACPIDSPGTERLVAAARASAIPIVMGRHILEPASDARVAVLEPTLAFASANVTYGLLEIPSNPQQIPFGDVVIEKEVVDSPSSGTSKATAGFFPSLATQAIGRFLGSHQDELLHVYGGRREPYVFVSTPDAFPNFSALQILCGEAATTKWTACWGEDKTVTTGVVAALRGRIVMIGEESSADVYSTFKGRMPGLVLQANYIDALLQRRFFFQLPAWMEFILFIAVVVMIDVFFQMYTVHRAYLIGAAVSTGLIILSYLIATIYGYLSSVGIFALLATFANFVFARLWQGRYSKNP